ENERPAVREAADICDAPHAVRREGLERKACHIALDERFRPGQVERWRHAIADAGLKRTELDVHPDAPEILDAVHALAGVVEDEVHAVDGLQVKALRDGIVPHQRGAWEGKEGPR